MKVLWGGAGVVLIAILVLVLVGSSLGSDKPSRRTSAIVGTTRTSGVTARAALSTILFTLHGRPPGGVPFYGRMSPQFFVATGDQFGIGWSYNCRTHPTVLLNISLNNYGSFNGPTILDSTPPGRASFDAGYIALRGAGVRHFLYVAADAACVYRIWVVRGAAHLIPSVPAQPTLATVKGASSRLTPRQKVRVVAILYAAVTHEQTVFQEGQAALGTTQYASATDALNALGDPTSAASRFAAFVHRAKVATDATFNHAFARANAVYPNQSEQQSNALGQWFTDIDNAHADLIQWTFDATNWLDTQESTSAFQAQAQTFQRDLSRARADVVRVLQAT